VDLDKNPFAEEMAALEAVGKEPALPRQRRKVPKPRTDIITEDSAACQFAEIYRDRLRFCHDTGAWFEWNGTVWRPNRTGLAYQWARELARRLSMSEPDKVRYVVNKTSFASGVERFARSDPTFAVTAEVWDADPFLLGTPGGTVDLRTGNLRPSEPAEGITRAASVAPADRADCPLWLQFLEEATGGDADLILFLQQWCGYALTGVTQEHALVFIHGMGGNGKSVFLNALTAVLNAYAVTAAMDTFTASNSDKHPTDLAMLRGARLVTASETEEGRAWAEARIKQITGSDPITARFMRRDFFTFIPQFKLTIVGNHRPVLKTVDDAIKRRFNIVPFIRKPANPDPHLETKLKAEYPAVLRWMIDGCLDWQKQGLTRPASVLEATADYFSSQDVFGQWLQDECDVEIGNHYKNEINGILFASWRAYAERAGESAGSQKTFAENMQRRGLERYRKKYERGFMGIRLRPAPEPYGDR
jgi:putative DNA primase/helicase